MFGDKLVFLVFHLGQQFVAHDRLVDLLHALETVNQLFALQLLTVYLLLYVLLI